MPSVPPQPQPRGIDYSLPTCRDICCNGHGDCVLPPGGGSGYACECDLGYKGHFCGETFNGSLSLPLTLGVVAVLVGLVTLAYILAKLRQKQKQRTRNLQKNLAKQQQQQQHVICEAGPSS